MKALFVFFTLISTLMASSYNFVETRYSDALDSSMELRGEISFERNSLFIKYTGSDRSILYKDSILTLKQNGEVLELDDVESQRISQYFEILLLLHEGDDELLAKKFEITKENNRTRLKPKEEIKRFIEKIILTKEKNTLQEVKLFLSNSDKITIRLEDEIR